MTPYDKFKSLPVSKNYLKPGLSFAILERPTIDIRDNQAAIILKKEDRNILTRFLNRKSRLNFYGSFRLISELENTYIHYSATDRATGTIIK